VAWIRALAVLAAIALPVTLLLCVPLSHDEHMYVAAGVLLRKYALYTDFAYLQAPYLPFVYSLAFGLTEGSHLLLCGRAVSLAMGLVCFYLVGHTCRELCQSRTAGMLCMVLFAGHHLTLFALPYARNHIVALGLALAAFCAIIHAPRAPARPAVWFAAAGILSGLAAGTKLVSAPLAVALLATCLAVPQRERLKDRILRGFLPFLLGLALSLLPALAILATTDPQVVLFDNLGYHRLNLLWRAAGDGSHAMTVGGKALFAVEYLVKGSGASLLIALGVVILRRGHARPGLAIGEAARSGDALTVIVLSLGAAVLAAFLPTPMQREYLAIVVPFLVLLLACLLGRWALTSDRVLRRALTGLAALAFLVAVATNLRHLRNLPHPSEWASIATYRAGQQLAQVTSRAGPAAKVATLAPIYPLEGGVQIYRELATGPFLYRVGDLLDPEQLQRYAGSSPHSIRSLLTTDPPDAILLGLEGRLEDPLAEFAQEHEYALAPIEWPRGRVYLRHP
jgi:hypothetical protein